MVNFAGLHTPEATSNRPIGATLGATAKNESHGMLRSNDKDAYNLA